MPKNGNQAKESTEKSPWPEGTARNISVPTFCTCTRYPGVFHGLSPGCPGMAEGERVRYVPGDMPGTISFLYDPDNPPLGPNADGTVSLIKVDNEQSQGVAGPQWPEVSSAWLFDEYEREIADRPQKLRDLRKAKNKFVRAFPMVPAGWPIIRDWLNTTYPGLYRPD